MGALLWFAVSLGAFDLFINRLSSGFNNYQMGVVLILLFVIMFSVVGETMDINDDDDNEKPTRRRLRRRILRRGGDPWEY